MTTAISVREKTRRHKRHVKSAGETRTTYVRSSAEETDGRTRRGARDGRGKRAREKAQETVEGNGRAYAKRRKERATRKQAKAYARNAREK